MGSFFLTLYVRGVNSGFKIGKDSCENLSFALVHSIKKWKSSIWQFMALSNCKTGLRLCELVVALAMQASPRISPWSPVVSGPRLTSWHSNVVMFNRGCIHHTGMSFALFLCLCGLSTTCVWGLLKLYEHMKGLACVSFDKDSPVEVWWGQGNVQGGVIWRRASPYKIAKF